MWLAGRDIITGYFVLVLFVFYIEGTGNSGMFFAAFSFAQDFPESRRGFVMGILLSFLGLVTK